MDLFGLDPLCITAEYTADDTCKTNQSFVQGDVSKCSSGDDNVKDILCQLILDSVRVPNVNAACGGLPRFFLLLLRGPLHSGIGVHPRKCISTSKNTADQACEPELERSLLNTIDLGEFLDPCSVELPVSVTARQHST